MAIAYVTGVFEGSTDKNGFTTSSVDTTGANFIVIGLTSALSTIGTVSDSKSNTWTPLTEYTGGFLGQYAQFFYAENPTVGSGHTFSVTGTNTAPVLCVGAFSGVATSSSFDVENGGASNFGSTVQPGNVTPSVDNELVVTMSGGQSSSTATIDSGFTVQASLPLVAGQHLATSFAYLIETTATAQNPTWSGDNFLVANIATFKAASGAAVVETNLNSIGTFKPTQLKAPFGLYRNYDVEPFFAVETNVHFLAKHVPTKLQVPLSLRQSHGYLPDVVSPEPHFVGRFKSTQLIRFNNLYFNPDIEPPVVETNVHFVGMFKPTKYSIDQSYRQIPDNQPSVIETNIHFVGTYKPVFSKFLPLLRQNYDQEPFFAVETNTNFIAKFVPTSLKVLTPYRWFYPEDVNTPVNIEPETNVNFIARFVSTKFYINPALRQHYDFNPPVIETNVSFVGKFNRTKFFLNQNLWQTDDIEPPVVETNVHFIAGFKPTKICLLQGLRSNPATDTEFSVAVTANPHFIARFSPTKLKVFKSLREAYSRDIPTFIARYNFYTQIIG